jgi:hypothetical protein
MKISEKSHEGKVFTITESFLDSPKKLNPKKCEHLKSILGPGARYARIDLNTIQLNTSLLKDLFQTLNSDKSRATAESTVDDKHEVVYLDITKFAKEVGADKLEKEMTKLLRFTPYILSTAEKVLLACPYQKVLPPTPEEKEAMKMGLIAAFGGASALAPVGAADEVEDEAAPSEDDKAFMKMLLKATLEELQSQPETKEAKAQIKEIHEALKKLA